MIKVGKDEMKFDEKHSKKYRRLSVRECARIQTFQTFNFHYSSIADGYKMIGNAVPVKLANVLAREIKKIFNAQKNFTPQTKMNSFKSIQHSKFFRMFSDVFIYK